MFGILRNRRGIFGSPISLKPDKVELLTITAVCLHNWLIRGVSKHVDLPQSLVDHVESTGEIVPGTWRDDVTATVCSFLPLQKSAHGKRPSSHAKLVRDEFKEYFYEEGEVSWQWSKCM